MWKRGIRKSVSLSLGAFRLLVGVPVRILHQLFTLAGWCKFRVDFEARPDDVFVVTYPRSGTTWLQMILYQLATDGSMRFDHISQVVPYFERMFMSGRNPNTMASPRLFKSHLPWCGG